MSRILKYILFFLMLGATFYVALGNFDLNETLLLIIVAIVTVATFFVLRKSIDKFSFSSFILVFLFLFIITIPMIGEKETESFEKRTLAPFPEFRFSNVWKFLFRYQDYFNDHFSFRNEAVQAISKFKLRLFYNSTMPQLVERGVDNWLFTTRPEYIDDTSTPFTPAQLDTVEANLEIITKYFDLRGIKYYFAMLPVKERIYPEYMSDVLRYKMRFSKAAQLNERIKNNPGIRSIDVKDVLIEGKKTLPTYYTTDTHWNQYGCFLGYRKIIERIHQDFPEIEPSVLEDYRIDTTTTDAGDLQLMMGFRDEFHFKHINLIHKSGIEPVIIDSTADNNPSSWRYSIREMPGVKNDLKFMLIRDSFSEYLRIFMTRDFKRTELIWTPVIPVAKVIEKKPDLVLQEILELFVMKTLILPPEIAGDTLFLDTHFPGYLRK